MKRLILTTYIALTATTVYAQGSPHFDNAAILMILFIGVIVCVGIILLLSYILYMLMNFYLGVLSEHTKRKTAFLPTFGGSLAATTLISVMLIPKLLNGDNNTYVHWSVLLLLTVSIGAVIGFVRTPTQQK